MYVHITHTHTRYVDNVDSIVYMYICIEYLDVCMDHPTISLLKLRRWNKIHVDSRYFSFFQNTSPTFCNSSVCFGNFNL